MTNTGYFNHYTTNTLWNPSPPKTLVFELLPGSPSLPSTRQQQSELEDGRDFMHTEEVIISAGTRAAARPPGGCGSGLVHLYWRPFSRYK